MSTELSDVGKASVRSSFFLFFGSTLSTIIMALASILIARLLGPENYGLYTLAMIPTSFLAAVSDLGISKALAPLLKVISKEDLKNLDELLKGLAPIYPIARWVLNLEEKILALNFTI
jgi:O-antigen/teichoic acid export membrane protein